MTVAETRHAAVPPAGLTEAEAARRLRARGELARPASSRSYRSIVVANVFTVFNAILGVFGVLTLAFGDPRDALFLGIVVSNALIGIVQEVRAKRALDRLSALVQPTATVVRDGHEARRRVEELVVGDLVILAPGDQLVADGAVLHAEGLRLDESVLTGESKPVARGAGETVRSGSFVVEGIGRCELTAVGEESYAERIAGQARAFRHPRSPLELQLNRLLLVLVGCMVPLAALLIGSLIVRDTPMTDAVTKATAAMTSLVPEGLILLASLTFAVAAVRMAARGALAQQLNAIESLASADVICLDKTGTLTEATLRVVDLVPAAGIDRDDLARRIGVTAASAATRNLTLAALAEAWPADARAPDAEVVFTSRRRWSALEADGVTVVLGAPELLAPAAEAAELADRAGREAEAGRRVLAVALAPAGLAAHDPDAGPPPGRRPAGLVILAERLRPDARETVAFLRREGVALKILSGDAPATVAAIARDAGLDAGAPLDGTALPDDDGELRRLARAAGVVGRISPDGKRRVVEALKADGAHVAMVGDGVNDVPALKAARLAIAQGTGAQMAKSVADVVLLSGDFSTVPQMVGEGRRILRNVQRVAKLFVSKSVFAAFLILTVGTTATAYPFLPRHLTVASTLGVGVPAFFLALAASSGPWRSASFLKDVARFAIPGGLAVGIGVLTAYLISLEVLGLSVREARTVSTTVLLAGMLFLIIALEAQPARRRHAAEALAAVMGGCYVVVLLWPFARDFFALARPTSEVAAVSALGVALAWGLVALGLLVAGRLHGTPG
ncbi:MAG TPA: HAD-IC family P-type ATPase [Solirubrobacteraceae bacterium]|nr:HAD-IC family P-type ATPase [Solirubrobacteraceae bacterium]